MKKKIMKVVGVLMGSTTFIWMELMEFASGNSKPPIFQIMRGVKNCDTRYMGLKIPFFMRGMQMNRYRLICKSDS